MSRDYADILHISYGEFVDLAESEYMANHPHANFVFRYVKQPQLPDLNDDLAEQIDLELTKQDLRMILTGLERKNAPREHRNGLQKKLSKVLRRATKQLRRTNDTELHNLISDANKVGLALLRKH